MSKKGEGRPGLCTAWGGPFVAVHHPTKEGTALLLTFKNPKLVKSTALGYEIAGLSLAHGNTSGYEVCRNRGECFAVCNATAGHAGIPNPTRGAGESLQSFARKARTVMLFKHRSSFFLALVDELGQFVRRAEAKGLTPAVRLNVYSDLPWERMPFTDGSGKRWRSVIDFFPDVQFYDYTKVPGRQVPANYHLTFSLDERNGWTAEAEFEAGRNVAVVLDVAQSKPLPAELDGTPVIDGDAHDLRFLDPKGVLVGLRAKGAARYVPVGGFVKASPDLAAPERRSPVAA